MTATTRTALTALVLGLTGDLLLRRIPWGLNFPLWASLFLAAAVVLTPSGRARYVIAAAALALACGFAWRDSGALLFLDVVLLIALVPLLALGPRQIRLLATGFIELAVASLFTVVRSVPAFFQVLADTTWGRLAPTGSMKRLGVLGRGLLIAAPALVIFGALLSSADPAFERLLHSLVYFELDEIVIHILVTLCIGAACAGVLRSFATGQPVTLPERPAILRLGIGETNVALTLVNVLFAGFVGVQVRYFFGGDSLVKIAGSLTYAEYARRGFFELVAVVGLVPPLLLAADWLVSRDDPRALRLFRLLAWLQIGLVFVIAGSAWKRMALYRDAYGQTELRFYATSFMLCIALLLVWMGVTVFTGRRERFVAGLIATAVVAVVVLHVVNPDDHIARTNIAREATGPRPLDAQYLRTLSRDAVPAILDGFGRIPPAEQPCLARSLERANRTRGSWRTWNASRAAAFDAVERRRPELRALAARCVPTPSSSRPRTTGGTSRTPPPPASPRG